jgi:hypothetical protein
MSAIVISAVSFSAVSEIAMVPDRRAAPTLIGVLSWPKAAPDEQPRAATPPAWINCLRSIPSPVAAAHVGRAAMQNKFCANRALDRHFARSRRTNTGQMPIRQRVRPYLVRAAELLVVAR